MAGLGGFTLDEVDLTESALDALGVDVVGVVGALRAGEPLPPRVAHALGHDLAHQCTTGAETAAVAMALAFRPPTADVLATIARGVAGEAAPAERRGVAHLAEHAPTGAAAIAIAALADIHGLPMAVLGAPAGFDVIARAAGAGSPALTAVRAVAGALATGASGLLVDLHLGVDLDLRTAEETAAVLAETAEAVELRVTIRTFRFRAPLGRAFGRALEAVEADAVLAGTGPLPLTRFVHSTVTELGALDDRAITLDRVPGSTEAVDADRPSRRAAISPAGGAVLRVDAPTLVAVGRLVDGIRVLHTVGEAIAPGQPVLEVIGDDDVTVQRALDALDGAWAVGPGGAPAPDPTPIAVTRAGLKVSESPLLFGP